MASKLKVDQIEGTSGSTITIPTGQTFTVTDGIAPASLQTVTVAKGGTNLTSFTEGDLLYATGATTLAKLAKGAASQALLMNSGATAPEWGTAGGAFENNLFHIVHETADGTAGSGTNASSWDTRIVNTIKTNEISGTLSSNVIGLGAGDYWIEGGAFFTNSGYVQTRLRDTTNSTTLVVGCNSYTEGYAGAWNTGLSGRFTLAGTVDMEVQYYCTTAYGTNGQGVASPSSGEVNRFADYMIWKL